MKANELSNQKLVELFITTMLEQNNIGPISQLSKDEKLEIRKLIKDIHKQISGFLAKQYKLDTEKKQSVTQYKKDRLNQNKVIATNDVSTLKMFQASLKQDHNK